MASTSAVKLDDAQDARAVASSAVTSAASASAFGGLPGAGGAGVLAYAGGPLAIPEEDAQLLATLGRGGAAQANSAPMMSKQHAFASDGGLPATTPKPGISMALDMPGLSTLHVRGAEDASQEGPISAYAKLEFPGFSYYIQTLDVLIGRRPGNAAAASPPAFEAGGDGMKQITGTRQEGHVDVDLGPMKSISRHHARIFYNPPGVPIPGDLGGYRGPAVPTEGTFVLEVLGRNGTFVDDVYLEKGHCVPLSKRTKVQIAERVFYFVLPPPAVPEEEDSDSLSTSEEEDVDATESESGDMSLSESELRDEAASKAAKPKAAAAPPRQKLVLKKKTKAQAPGSGGKGKGKGKGKGPAEKDEPASAADAKGKKSNGKGKEAETAKQANGTAAANRKRKRGDAAADEREATLKVGEPIGVEVLEAAKRKAAKEKRTTERSPSVADGDPDTTVAATPAKVASASKAKAKKADKAEKAGSPESPAKVAKTEPSTSAAPLSSAAAATTAPAMPALKPPFDPTAVVPPSAPTPGPATAQAVQQAAAVSQASSAAMSADMNAERPELTNVQLIMAALTSEEAKSKGDKLTLHEVYEWLGRRWPWFKYNGRHNGRDWQSAVRHCIGSSKEFEKVPRKDHESGKGIFYALYNSPVAQQTRRERAEKLKEQEAMGAAPSATPFAGLSQMRPLPPAAANAAAIAAAQMAATQGQPGQPPVSTPTAIAARPAASLPTNPAGLQAAAHPAPPFANPAAVTARPVPPGQQYRPPIPPGAVAPRPPVPQARPPAAAQQQQGKAPGTTASRPLPGAGLKLPPARATPMHMRQQIAGGPGRPGAFTGARPGARPTMAAGASQSPPAQDGQPGRIQIVIGPAPPHAVPANRPTPAPGSIESLLDAPPIIHHDGKLYLNPQVFAKITYLEVQRIETLGIQAALKELQAYLVTYLKEKLRERQAKKRAAEGSGTSPTPPAGGASGSQAGSPPPLAAGVKAGSPVAGAGSPPPAPAGAVAAAAAAQAQAAAARKAGSPPVPATARPPSTAKPLEEYDASTRAALSALPPELASHPEAPSLISLLKKQQAEGGGSIELSKLTPGQIELLKLANTLSNRGAAPGGVRPRPPGAVGVRPQPGGMIRPGMVRPPAGMQARPPMPGAGGPRPPAVTGVARPMPQARPPAAAVGAGAATAPAPAAASAAPSTSPAPAAAPAAPAAAAAAAAPASSPAPAPAAPAPASVAAAPPASTATSSATLAAPSTSPAPPSAADERQS